MTAAEASDVRKSDIRNDGDSANDIYNVADVASKIDDNGAGDIVAVYMYDDDMGEKISIKGAKVELANSGTITVGQENLDVTVTLPQDENLDTSKVYVQVVDKDGKVVISKTNVTDAAQKLVLNTKDLREGTYTVQLFGYNKTDKKDDLLAEATLTVGAATKYAVSKVEWVTKTGDPSDVPVVEAGTNGVFYVKVTSDPANAVLAKENLEVRVKGSKVDFELVSMGNGVYKITVADGKEIKTGDQVEVTLKTGAAVTSVPNAPIMGNAKEEAKAPVTSEEAKKAGDIKVTVDTTKTELNVVVVEGDVVTRANGESLKNLLPANFSVTVNGTTVNDLEVSGYNIGIDGYKLTSKSVGEWDGAKISNIVVTVGEYSETYNKVAGTSAIDIADQKNDYTIDSDIPESGFEFGALNLTNLTASDIKVKEIKKNNVPESDLTKITIKDGKVYLAADLFSGLTNNQTVKFKLTNGAEKDTVDSAEFTVTAKDAPAPTATIASIVVDALGGTNLTSKVTNIQNTTADELELVKESDADSVVTASSFDPAKSEIKVTVAPGKAGKTATYKLQTKVGQKSVGKLTISPTKATVTIADAKTEATPTITMKLQSKGTDLTSEQWTALGVNAALTTANVKVTVQDGTGEQAAQAVVATSAPTITITSKDAIVKGKTVTVKITGTQDQFTITGADNISITNSIA